MIFLTVGSQSPFDRLVQCVDEWNASAKCEVIAQIGSGQYEPKNLTWFRFCPPVAYRGHCREADLIVAHAGMGAIITGMEFRRSLILFPRRADLRETRNDHQIATSNWMRQKSGITVACNEDELRDALASWRRAPTDEIAATAQTSLVTALREFIAAS